MNVNPTPRLLLVILAFLFADAFAADPPASTSGGQSSAGTPVRKVLVDDTLNDAQLKQILAKGYRPEAQAPGHEVSYCRGEYLSGDRFVTKVCKTGAQILEDEQRGRDLLTSVERIGLQSAR
jgi:hypothetical protein